MGEEHRDARAVFAAVEDLFGDVIVGVEVDFGLAHQRALAGEHVVAVDAGGPRVA